MSNEPPTYEDLKNKFETLKSTLNEAHPLRQRLHRSLSWFKRACDEDTTQDQYRNHARCIFLWIAFNAAYAIDRDPRTESDHHRRSESDRFCEFLRLLIALDCRRIYRVVSSDLRSWISDLISNEYVFQKFWDNPDSETMWEQYDRDIEDVNELLKCGSDAYSAVSENELRKPLKELLDRVFSRLYVLRNQLMHGFATAGGFMNRRQAQTGAAILDVLVPIFLDNMTDYPDSFSGRVPYAVSDDNRNAGRRRGQRAGSP